MGLIEQPHTSAGRVPSDAGYRYYVDYLMAQSDIQEEAKADDQPGYSGINGSK